MKLIFRNKTNECIKSFSLKNFESYQKIIEELRNFKQPVSASLITKNEQINSHEFLKFKLALKSLNISFIHIFSNNRETVLSGKSLKINSTLINKIDANNEFFTNFSYKSKDILHKGTIRSGNRISSNGNLFIMGDVNPGAMVTASNSIYVWGKLLGIALAGQDGDTKASIASLYLNPLQLRICNIIAIGPKEKPKHQYPEVAVIEDKEIVIKPYSTLS